MAEQPRERRDPTELLLRLLEAERHRSDSLLTQQASAFATINTRLTAIEARLAQALTPTQWVKALAGLGLPLAALWLTGSAEVARQLLPIPWPAP